MMKSLDEISYLSSRSDIFVSRSLMNGDYVDVDDDVSPF